MSHRRVDPLGCRLHGGDPTVLSEVLRLYCPSLAHELHSRSDRPLQAADIEDVLNVALDRLWQSRATYNPRRRLKSWFRTIALNVAKNLSKYARRKVRRRQVLTDPEEMDRLPCRECADETRLKANIKLERVLWALPCLPENYRRIMLADAHDPTGTAPTNALAEELGLSPSTIREYRRRAPAKVRRILERQEREREREREAKSTVQMRSVTGSCK